MVLSEIPGVAGSDYINASYADVLSTLLYFCCDAFHLSRPYLPNSIRDIRGRIATL